GPLAPAQEQFLDQAVAGLAQDGKVIPVRLSLFAEMIKAKPWQPQTLHAAGGAEGIGTAFLEETFASPSANPKHRLHQRAARAVVHTVLPELGSDIKGHLACRQQLLEASGYARQPRQFEDLIRILDTELRLVTPTDPEGVDEGEEAPGPSPGQYYQLTHD